MVKSSPGLTVQQALKALRALQRRMMTDDSPSIISKAIDELEANNAFAGLDTNDALQVIVDYLEREKEVPTMNRRAAERVKAWAGERGYGIKIKKDKSDQG